MYTLAMKSNQDVYFDDLVINHKRGPVVEVNDYYPFGMAIVGLNSKAIGFGGSDNRYKFNGKELQNKEFSDGEGLEWTDFGARMYDPQIGMWMRPDRLAEVARKWSRYNYALDNPIRFIDPDGMWTYDANGNAATNDQAEINAFFQETSDNGGDKDKDKKKITNKNKKLIRNSMKGSTKN